MNSIILKNINIQDNSKNILQDINIEFKRPYFYGILGKNGSGKSSLLKVTSGINTKYNGQIFFNGEEFTNIYDNMGFLFQTLYRPDNFTVRDFFNLNILYNKNNNYFEKFIYILSYLKIEKLINSELSKLSGGEWKKVQFSIVMSCEKPFYFFDELDSEIDVSSKIKIISLLKNIKIGAKCCVVASSHDVSFLNSFCDFFIVLENGKIVFNESNTGNDQMLKSKLIL